MLCFLYVPFKLSFVCGPLVSEPDSGLSRQFTRVGGCQDKGHTARRTGSSMQHWVAHVLCFGYLGPIYGMIRPHTAPRARLLRGEPKACLFT